MKRERETTESDRKTKKQIFDTLKELEARWQLIQDYTNGLRDSNWKYVIHLIDDRGADPDWVLDIYTIPGNENSLYSSQMDTFYHVSALHIVCINGCVGVAKLLIQKGADVNAATKEEGWTSLHFAAMNGHADVANLLIRNGAHVNALAKDNLTNLHYAVLNGHVDVVNLLIRNGADVNAVTKINWTSLHIAIHEEHVDIAKLLIQNGADVNAATKETKCTSLRLAVERDYIDVAKLLIRNGADVNALDKKNMSALHFVCRYCLDSQGILPIVLTLISFGAKIDYDSIKADQRLILLRPIEERLEKLRNGERITHLYSNEEERFMWNIKFCLTWKYKVASFKAYYTIRSFVTFNGIFMAPGFDLGDKSIWGKKSLWGKVGTNWILPSYSTHCQCHYDNNV